MPAYSTTDYLALKARVDALTISPTMQVYEPGAIFTAPTDAVGPAPYVLLSDVPNAPDRGNRIDPNLHMRSGVFMLTVMWPVARAVSHAQLKEIAGQIAEQFPAGLCLNYGQSRLRVTQDSAALQPFVEGAYRVAVVRVFWSSM